MADSLQEQSIEKSQFSSPNEKKMRTIISEDEMHEKKGLNNVHSILMNNDDMVTNSDSMTSNGTHNLSMASTISSIDDKSTNHMEFSHKKKRFRRSYNCGPCKRHKIKCNMKTPCGNCEKYNRIDECLKDPSNPPTFEQSLVKHQRKQKYLERKKKLRQEIDAQHMNQIELNNKVPKPKAVDGTINKEFDIENANSNGSSTYHKSPSFISPTNTIPQSSLSRYSTRQDLKDTTQFIETTTNINSSTPDISTPFLKNKMQDISEINTATNNEHINKIQMDISQGANNSNPDYFQQPDMFNLRKQIGGYQFSYLHDNFSPPQSSPIPKQQHQVVPPPHHQITPQQPNTLHTNMIHPIIPVHFDQPFMYNNTYNQPQYQPQYQPIYQHRSISQLSQPNTIHLNNNSNSSYGYPSVQINSQINSQINPQYQYMMVPSSKPLMQQSSSPPIMQNNVPQQSQQQQALPPLHKVINNDNQNDPNTTYPLIYEKLPMYGFEGGNIGPPNLKMQMMQPPNLFIDTAGQKNFEADRFDNNLRPNYRISNSSSSNVGSSFADSQKSKSSMTTYSSIDETEQN